MLKPDGLIFLAPAWRLLAAFGEGYHVRPYSDLGIRGKLEKASIPIRESAALEASYMLPIRLIAAKVRTP